MGFKILETERDSDISPNESHSFSMGNVFITHRKTKKEIFLTLHDSEEEIVGTVRVFSEDDRNQICSDWEKVCQEIDYPVTLEHLEAATSVYFERIFIEFYQP